MSSNLLKRIVVKMDMMMMMMMMTDDDDDDDGVQAMGSSDPGCPSTLLEDEKVEQLEAPQMENVEQPFRRMGSIPSSTESG